VKIRLPQGPETMVKDVIRQISRVMRQHPGGYQAIVYLPANEARGKVMSYRTGPELWADGSDMFRQRIQKIVGEENFKDA
jgi:hypothetical protein